MHLLGHQRHVFADRDSIGAGRDLLERSASRCARLEIPDIDRAGATPHPEQNRGLVPLSHVSGIGKDRVGKDRCRPRQCGRPREMTEEVPPAHSQGNTRQTIRANSATHGKPPEHRGLMIDDELVGIEHGPPDVLEGPGDVPLAGGEQGICGLQFSGGWLTGQRGNIERLDLLGWAE